MSIDNLVETLQNEKRKYRELIDAIDVLLAKYERTDSNIDEVIGNGTRGTTVVIPETFEVATTWKEKTLFGLNQCPNKKGFTIDIVNALKGYDSTITKDNTTAFHQITVQASKLAKNRTIGYRSFGNKNQYFIKM